MYGKLGIVCCGDKKQLTFSKESFLKGGLESQESLFLVLRLLEFFGPFFKDNFLTKRESLDFFLGNGQKVRLKNM